MEKFKKDKIKHDDNSRYKDSKLSIFPLIESIKIYISKSYRNFKADDNRSFTQSYFSDAIKLLLDTYPNASAAYSLRKLSSSYQGPAIRVRRSSDNQEQDIYFDSLSNLDTNTLVAWVNTPIERVVNGSFTSDTVWTKGVGWSIANNKASKITGSASSLFQSCLIAGQTYNFTMVITDYVSGNVTLRNGTGSGIEYTYISAKSQNGTFTSTATLAPLSNANLVISASSDFVGSISFVSATQIMHDGFVTTWYDQSGNSRNATQSTAASQPQIVSQGNVVLKNGKASLDFDGANDNLIHSNNFMGQSSGSVFSVSSFDNSTRTAREIIYGIQDTVGSRYDFLVTRQASNSLTPLIPNAIDFYLEGDFQTIVSPITDTDQHIFSAIYSNNARRILYNNGSALSTYTNINLGNIDDGTAFIIGSDISSSAYIDGKIQEIIIWNSDQNPNLNGINTNINTYYGIY